MPLSAKWRPPPPLPKAGEDSETDKEDIKRPKPRALIKYMGQCQNYGPFLGTLNIRCRIIIGIPKGTIILTTTHIHVSHVPGEDQKDVADPVPTSAEAHAPSRGPVRPKPYNFWVAVKELNSSFHSGYVHIYIYIVINVVSPIQVLDLSCLTATQIMV